jgi:hypothetical protein
MFVIFYFGFTGLLLVAGGVALWRFARRYLQLSSLLRRPLSRIGKLRPGSRKVRGKVVPLGEVLRGPLSNKECVYYKFSVEEDRTTYKDNPFDVGEPLLGRRPHLDATAASYLIAGGRRKVHSNRTLLDLEDEIPFMIEDDTGNVEVDLDGATVFVKEKLRIVSNEDRALPPHLLELLQEEYDIYTVDDRGSIKTLVCYEEIIPVGAKITIAGRVEEITSGDLCFQQDDGPFIVSDRDVVKEGQSAHSRAMGFTLGAGACLGLGIVCLLGAFVLLLIR